MNPNLNAFCHDLYGEVQQYWGAKRNVLPQTWDLKFGIFYSPVRYRPTLMIIGANPGYDEDDDTMRPPEENLFFEWPPPPPRKKDHYAIVPVLRGLFQRAHQEEILRDSVITNLLFFKSRCLAKDKKRRQGWRDNGNPKARREIEDYCQNKVEEIASRLDPSQILVLGMASWDRLAENQVKVLSPKRNVRIAAIGTIFKKNALGIIHPTGARINHAERREIAKRLGEFLRN